MLPVTSKISLCNVNCLFELCFVYIELLVSIKRLSGGRKLFV